MTRIDGQGGVGEYAANLPLIHVKLSDGRSATLCGCEMNAMRERSWVGEIEGTAHKTRRWCVHWQTLQKEGGYNISKCRLWSLCLDTCLRSCPGTIANDRNDVSDNSFRLEFGDFSIGIEARDSQALSPYFSINLSHKSLSHVDEFFDMVFIRLLSFLTLMSGNLNYMHSFIGQDSNGEVEVIRNHPWYSKFRDDGRIEGPFLQYDDLDKAFQTMLRNWIFLWDDVGYLYDEYFSMLYNRPIHPRQAERSAYAVLEGLHKRFNPGMKVDEREPYLVERLRDTMQLVIPLASETDKQEWSQTAKDDRNRAQHGDRNHGVEDTGLRCARLMAVIYMYTLVNIGLPFERNREEYYILFNKVYQWMKTLFLSANELSSNPSRSTGYVVPTPDGYKRVAHTDELAGIPIQIIYDKELAKRFADLDNAIG